MGLISKLLSFVRNDETNVNDVKVDPGAGANITVKHFGPIGDDSNPLPDDFVVSVPVAGSGRGAAVGYLDVNNQGEAEPGDKRIYSRGDDGVKVAEIWLKNDGIILIKNDNGSVQLNADGTFTINGSTITTDGDFVTDDNISLKNHTHVGNLGAATSTPTPTPGA